MYRLSYTFAILCASFLTNAQTSQKRQVIAVIDTFFEGMKNGNILTLKATLESDCSLQSIALNKDSGDIEVRKESIEKFIEAISEKDPSVTYDERISSYEIKIDGPMAVAWTPYKFYINGNFSHCGVNVFSLVKRKENWRITSIMDTRRKTECL